MCPIWVCGPCYTYCMSYTTPDDDTITVSTAREILGYEDRHSVINLARRGVLQMWTYPGGRMYFLSRREVEALRDDMRRQAERDRAYRQLERQLLFDF